MSRIPDTHAEAWALLPWLANGRIAPEEREWVEAHLITCADCRAELASQRKVAGHMAGAADAPLGFADNDEHKSFNKLWARIEASETATKSVAGTDGPVAAPRASRAVRWLAAAVVVQAIGLGILGLTTLRGSAGPDDFAVTVSKPFDPLKSPAVRLVFEAEASMETVNTLLTHQGLQLVEGPGTQGNFTAILSADAVASGASAESVAAVLSKDPNVSFAQPVAR